MIPNKCSSSFRKEMKRKRLYFNIVTGLLAHSTMKYLSNHGILLHPILVHFVKATLKTKKSTITILSTQYNVTLAAVLPTVYVESLAMMMQSAGSSTPVHFLPNPPSLSKGSHSCNPYNPSQRSTHQFAQSPTTATLEG